MVEAIVEDHAAKAALFGELGATILAADAVLATTTSSLSVGRARRRRAGAPSASSACTSSTRCRRWSWSSSPSRRGDAGHARARARAVRRRSARPRSRSPTRRASSSTACCSRTCSSAVELLERTGLDAEAVDTCMKLGAGHPMGPLALLDLVGLDVAQAIGETIGVEVPPRVRRSWSPRARSAARPAAASTRIDLHRERNRLASVEIAVRRHPLATNYPHRTPPPEHIRGRLAPLSRPRRVSRSILPRISLLSSLNRRSGSGELPGT